MNSAAPPIALFQRRAVARCLPFALYMAFIGLNELLLWTGFSAHELRWLYAVKTGAVVIALGWFWRDYADDLQGARPGASDAIVAAITGVVVLVLWLNLGAGWMTIGSAAGFDPTSNGRIDWPLAAVRLAGAALVVPVMEELFWRSFLLRWLDNPNFSAVAPAAVSVRAIAISSLLFGVEHNLWLAGVVAGLAYALLYRWRGTLLAPILAHAVTNGLLGAWVLATASWQYW